MYGNEFWWQWQCCSECVSERAPNLACNGRTTRTGSSRMALDRAACHFFSRQFAYHGFKCWQCVCSACANCARWSLQYQMCALCVLTIPRRLIRSYNTSVVGRRCHWFWWKPPDRRGCCVHLVGAVGCSGWGCDCPSTQTSLVYCDSAAVGAMDLVPFRQINSTACCRHDVLSYHLDCFYLTDTV